MLHRPNRVKGGRDPRAFALVELLTVLAIVAVLAGILFPVFARAKAAAKVTSCLANLRQIGFGYLAYAGDHDGMTVPPRYFYDPDASIRRDIQYWYAHAHDVGGEFVTEEREGLLHPYLAGELLTRCPAADYADGSGFKFAYGINIDLRRYVREPDLHGVIPDSPFGIPLAEVERPAETVAFADSAVTNGAIFGGDGSGVASETDLYPPSDPRPKISSVHARHGGGANVAWIDGHAKAMRVAFPFDSALGKLDRRNDLGELIDPRHPYDRCTRKTAKGECAEDAYFLLAKPTD